MSTPSASLDSDRQDDAGLLPATGDAAADETRFIQWLATLSDLASGLRQLRAAQGLTLQEVADMAGLHKASVLRFEQGTRRPERDTLVALLLAAFSLPVPLANRMLLWAGYAPLHHQALALSRPRRPETGANEPSH